MRVDISKFEKTHLLVVGDLMIDEYLWGEVDRISPEAPVQVVAVQNQDYTLGGSGNVVYNLRALGARVSVLGVIGDGSDGKLLFINDTHKKSRKRDLFLKFDSSMMVVLEKHNQEVYTTFSYKNEQV